MKELNCDWRLDGEDETFISSHKGVDFDEIVVGDWLHVEMMDRDHAWMHVAGRSFDIYINDAGEIVLKEQTT